jgi:hypothetical protein
MTKNFFNNIPLPAIKSRQSSNHQSNGPMIDTQFCFQDLGECEHEKLNAKLYRPYFITLETINKFKDQADLDVDLSIIEIVKTFMEGPQKNEKLFFKVDKKHILSSVSGS